MTFTSIQFFGFIPIVLSLYFLIPVRFRWSVLLFSSYYFYLVCLGLNFFYIALLFVSSAISYILAIKIYYADTLRRKKVSLLVGIIFFLLVLFVFKYYNFASENINTLFGFNNTGFSFPFLNLAIPLGISFYTFQIVSYLLDVYYSRTEPVRHFGIYLTGIAYFPKLISGPIERTGDFIPQLFLNKNIENQRIVDGSKLFLWGLFKKVVIADRLSFAVNLVFNHPENYFGSSLFFAIFFLSIQIYADFSGYTDMAIGISKLFGIKLTENFDRPYFSASFTEFWRKWHITLSFWLRDYIFLPIAYSISSKIVNFKWKVRPDSFSYVTGILVTMVICGFWHGAKWTFVIWGFLHGLFLAVGFLLKKKKKKFYKNLKINASLHKGFSILTCFALVSFAWIFFKVNSIGEGVFILKNIWFFSKSINPICLFEYKIDLYVSAFSIAFLFFMEFIWNKKVKSIKDYSITKLITVPVLILIIFSIWLFGNFTQIDFLYFSF